MENPTTTDHGRKLNKFVYEKFQSKELSNSDLVELIILLFDLLGLKTIAKYAKLYGKTYSGVEKFNKNIVKINGNKFIINND